MNMKSAFSNSSHNIQSNHLNTNYMAIVEQKTNSSQSASECRTPIAWHNRTINLTKPMTLVQNSQTVATNYTAKYRRASGQRPSQRASSPSATTTSSDDREEVPMVRHHLRRPNSRVTNSSALTVDRRQQNFVANNKLGNHILISGEYAVHPMHALRSGTLRSTKSVPTLAMASAMNDPCPVHGGNQHNHGLLIQACPPPHAHHFFPSMTNHHPMTFRRFGSYADIRETRGIPVNTNGLPFLTPIPEHKQCRHQLMPIQSIYYSPSQPSLPSLPALPAPNSIPLQLMPPKSTTRSMVFPAYAEPLPFRNHFKVSSPVSPVPSHQTVKMNKNYGTFSDDMCCRGQLIVLWVILGVITVGVISGIILAVTMN